MPYTGDNNDDEFYSIPFDETTEAILYIDPYLKTQLSSAKLSPTQTIEVLSSFLEVAALEDPGLETFKKNIMEEAQALDLLAFQSTDNIRVIVLGLKENVNKFRALTQHASYLVGLEQFSAYETTLAEEIPRPCEHH